MHFMQGVVVGATVLLGAEVTTGQGLPGEVLDKLKVGDLQGGLSGVNLLNGDSFGQSLAWLGDLDGDGIGELAVAATGDKDGAVKSGFTGPGAIYVLFLEADGTLRGQQKISALAGNFLGDLDDVDLFGSALAGLGDLDGDGVPDLAVGALGDDDGGLSTGAVWILFLRPDGSVKSHQKISALAGGFVGPLHPRDWFGSSLAALGDLDGDGIGDLAVGAQLDADGGEETGAVWIVFLRADGTVKAQQKISALHGGFQGELEPRDIFGNAVAALGFAFDPEHLALAVGASYDDDGTTPLEPPIPYWGSGAVWILLLNADGTVHRQHKISATLGGFGGSLGDQDRFGASLAALGDLDGDGFPDLAVGAPVTQDGPGNFWRGATWLLFLGPGPTVRRQQKLSMTDGGFGFVPKDAFFGSSVAALPDFDGNGVANLAVGMPGDKEGGFFSVGSLWLLNLRGAVWTDLGLGLPGALGSPQLSGLGSLVAQQHTVLQLENAASLAPVMLFAGATRIDSPLLGGVLVPSPDSMTVLTTDVSGAATLTGRWPSGLPTETTVSLQAWVADATGPRGYAASNALSATTP